MKIKKNHEMAICSVDILDINCVEMKQMQELNNRIKAILNSHKEGSEKKEYISDDELLLMQAILTTFTKEYASNLKSAFDDTLNELKKPAKPEPILTEDTTFG